jgi:ureidoacrylate peracid hydrolase
MTKNSKADNLSAARELAHVPLLATLAEKVAPRHTALLVVDMQNDFCADNGFVCRGGRDVSAVKQMAKQLPGFIAVARKSGVLVVFVRSVYSMSDNRFLSDVWLEQAARKQGGGYTLTPVCGEGSWEGDYYADVRPDPRDVVVSKHRYNAFHSTDLDLILRTRGIRTVVVTGVSTNVCVETTARDSFVRDFYTIVVADGTAAYSNEEHELALKTIDRFFGEVTSIEDLTALWIGRNG